MTTPHPTPEERVEAALKEWREDAGDLRIHFANAIREAEAAGEARGRAMEREACASIADRAMAEFSDLTENVSTDNAIKTATICGVAAREIADAIRARGQV